MAKRLKDGKRQRAAKARRLVNAGEIMVNLWIILSRDISEQMLYRGVQSRTLYIRQYCINIKLDK
jgi:hypothetical protein